ncbi:microcin H47, partial [Salmonella enterica]|nr:microcin H47 [Salmonella enterica]
PATTANAVGAAAIVGALAGIPGGPVGMVGGAFVAGLTTAIGATAGNSSSASSSAGGGS